VSAERGVRIRDARADDAATLTRIAREAKASWGYPPEWLDRWREELTITPDYVRAHRVLVAEDGGGSPRGLIAVGAGARGAEIEHLWVDPAAQRRGIGAALLRAALADAANPALRIVSDPHAAGFYRRHGAREIGRVAAPMPGAEDRVLPVLEIDAARSTQRA
jgi:ribosomal protein S18 acetylase RimI-like enzyme